MSSVVETERLTKRYGRRQQALTDCDLDIPQGRLVGLVGPNGAGKSTLLQLCCGLIAPSSGVIRVLGARPGANAAHLAKVGFVAQDAPVYRRLSVADHLRMGARLNPGWDVALAERRVKQIGLDPRQKAGRLSGGQRAQLALTIAAAKRPELLIFDEPAAALDPLARDGFLESLMESVTDLGAGALLSSHALADVERVCDYLIVLSQSRIQVAGDVRELLAGHRRVVGTRADLERLPSGIEVVRTEHAPGRSSAVVRVSGAMPVDAPWAAESIDLGELVLAYLTRAGQYGAISPTTSTPQEARR